MNAVRQERECVISFCWEKIPEGCGIVCAADHALCDGCFNASVLTQTSSENFHEFVRRKAKLACLYCKPPTTLPPAMQVQAKQRLDAAGQDAYERARDAYAVRQVLARSSKEIEELQVQLARDGADPEQRVRQHLVWIEENILMLRCPKCRQLTAGNWDACFKISCDGCNGTFCAWCLQAPANHAHVKTCTKNPHPGTLFGNLQEWAAVRKPVLVKKLREYLHDIERVRADDRMKLATALTARLADVGIRPQEIYVELRLSQVWPIVQFRCNCFRAISLFHFLIPTFQPVCNSICHNLSVFIAFVRIACSQPACKVRVGRMHFPRSSKS